VGLIETETTTVVDPKQEPPRAEGYLAQALLTLHLLRIQISAGGLQ
jgi:hypothetical protein